MKCIAHLRTPREGASTGAYAAGEKTQRAALHTKYRINRLRGVTMGQPIHYANVKHRTCQTANGQRRSPVAGPSYESDMELLDRTTGKTLHRKHTDGTQVIYSEIFSSDQNCKYADKSIPVQSRRTELWNDLYAENKSNSERIAAYGEIAIPNNITDEEMIALAKRLGQHFSTTYKRPVDLSIHKKRGNNHIHFSIPEREYKNGRWLQKRKKFYKDWNGNLIHNKIYKDSNGWDIRKPKIDKKIVPAGADPYERDRKTGDYLYQKLGERNKKKWEEDTRTGKFLEPEELSQLHNDIDDIVNTFLREQGYNVTVKRNRPEVTKLMKELGIKQIRIATSDYKTNSPVVEEIQKKNARNKTLQRAIEENFDKEEKAEIDLAFAENEETKTDALATLYTEERKTAEKNLEKARQEEQRAIEDYIETELKPDQIFIADYTQPHKESLEFKEAQCSEAVRILSAGSAATEDSIKNLEQKNSLTEQEENRLHLLRKNKISWDRSREKVSEIRKRNNAQAVRKIYQEKWNGLSGWKRANYIYSRVGHEAGIIYRDYLITKGYIRPEDNPDTTIPAKVSFERALQSIVNGKSVPGIKAHFDRTLSAKDNVKNAATSTFSCWEKNTRTELHNPPAPEDFEFLTAVNTAPERFQQIAEGRDQYNIYKAIPTNYNPAEDYQIYKEKEEAISKKEAEAKRLAEAARLAAKRAMDERIAFEKELAAWTSKKEMLEKEYRKSVNAIIAAEAERAILQQQQYNQQYENAQAHVLQLYDRYKDIEEEERQKERASHFWNSYTADVDRINEAFRDWYRADDSFRLNYSAQPKEPDKEAILKKTQEHYSKMEYLDIIKAARRLDISVYHIRHAHEALTEHLRRKPSGSAIHPEQVTMTPEDRTQRSRSGRDSAKKPYTGR